jgi:hypothetical protein
MRNKKNVSLRNVENPCNDARHSYMSLNLIITHRPNQWRSDRIGRVGKAQGAPSPGAPEYQGKFIQLVYRKDIKAVK